MIQFPGSMHLNLKSLEVAKANQAKLGTFHETTQILIIELPYLLDSAPRRLLNVSRLKFYGNAYLRAAFI